MPDFVFQLKNIKKVLNGLGSPHLTLPVISVAGTNGKGSTSHFLEKIALIHQKKTGLYTSPHIFNFRERIKLNGLPVNFKVFKDTLRKVRSEELKAEVQLTKFEQMTACAIVIFSNFNCDIAIMEVGLGGRLDATNVCENKKISVITPVSKDHSEYLGNSIEKIGKEKSGIIKESVPVVDFSNTDIVRDTALRLRCPVYSENREYSVLNITPDDRGFYIFDYISGSEKIRRIVPGLRGKFQVENAAAAITAARILGLKDADKLKQAIKETRLPGRLEIYSRKERTVLVDSAHNPAAVEEVIKFIRDNKPPGSDLYLVMGVYKDKDYSNMVKSLIRMITEAMIFTPENCRALKAEKLQKLLRKKAEVRNSFWECYSSLINLSSPGDWILICGSFSVVKPALIFLNAKIGKA